MIYYLDGVDEGTRRDVMEITNLEMRILPMKYLSVLLKPGKFNRG